MSKKTQKKTLLVLLSVLVLTGFAGSAQALDYGYVWPPLIGQKTNMWCWAGTLEMSVAIAGASVQQCEQANKRFNMSNCCQSPTPSACINGGWPEYDRWGFDSKILPWGQALTFDQIKAQIQSGRATNVSWGWAGGGGHIMVARGYYEDGPNYRWVLINDPWPPNSGTVFWVTYPDYVAKAGSYSHWRDYYDITKRQLTFMVNVGDNSCPAGYRLATYAEASGDRNRACSVLGTWYIARLQGGGSMDGSGYACKTREQDTRSLGHSLCVK